MTPSTFTYSKGPKSCQDMTTKRLSKSFNFFVVSVLPVQIKEMEMAISHQSRCSQCYLGQSIETSGFFLKCGSFGCLLVQKFTKKVEDSSWVELLYIVYFHFRVFLGVAWDWKSAKHVPSPLDFSNHFAAKWIVWCVSSCGFLISEFSLTMQMQKCLLVERLRMWIEAQRGAADLESPKVVCVLSGIFQDFSRIQNACQKSGMFVIVWAEAVPQGLQWFGKFRISFRTGRGGSYSKTWQWPHTLTVGIYLAYKVCTWLLTIFSEQKALRTIRDERFVHVLGIRKVA